MPLGDWEQVSEESLVRYKVFDVVKSRRRSPRTGAEIGFFLVRTPDWVNVSEEMVGHKFGEFAPTRAFHGHGGDKKVARKPAGK